MANLDSYIRYLLLHNLANHFAQRQPDSKKKKENGTHTERERQRDVFRCFLFLYTIFGFSLSFHVAIYFKYIINSL